MEVARIVKPNGLLPLKRQIVSALESRQSSIKRGHDRDAANIAILTGS